MVHAMSVGLAALCCLTLLMSTAAAQGEASREQGVRDIGSRLELFVDDWLIEKMDGAELRLHHPVPREEVLSLLNPWEGNTCCYFTVFEDEGMFRMYYRGSNFDWATNKGTHQVACYAESKNGVDWTKPVLNLFEFEGSKENNIVWVGPAVHNFTPFKDMSPDCEPEARYKALGSVSGGLVAFASPDGLDWSLMQDEPVITEGAFDSQNLAFWDAVRGQYVDYHRGFRDGVRDIMTCTSDDFINWTDPQWLDWGDTPLEHLYTNAVRPYFRAPHILMGFPKRFLPARKKVAEHPYPGVSDGVFMTSRDGVRWNRWREGFLRPGQQKSRWWERNNMIAWGMLVTKSNTAGAPDELSLYATEGHYEDSRLRRFTLRIDGFVSVNAGFPGGAMVTRPLTFEGKELVLNYATSAAGSVRVEIANSDGEAIEGFSLDECPEIYGDELEEAVRWESGSDVSALAGQIVRLRFVLKDADLYSIRFR